MWAEKEQPLAVRPSPATTSDVLHSQQLTQVQTTSMFSSFSAAANFLGRPYHAWQCPHAPEGLQAALARERLPRAQRQPGQSIPSYTPDEPAYSPGTTWRKLHLAWLPWAPWAAERSFSAGCTAHACWTCAAGGGRAFRAREHEIAQMQRLRTQRMVMVSQTPSASVSAVSSTFTFPVSWLIGLIPVRCVATLLFIFQESLSSLRRLQFLISNVMKYPHVDFFRVWLQNILPVAIPI